MKFKEYFLITRTTTKSCLRITSIIFGIIFVIFSFAMKIKDPSSTDIGKIQMMLVRFLFIYGITIFIFLCAITGSYSKANNTIKFYHSIPANIKDKFYLILHPKQLNIKYNYLDFEIIGEYNNQLLCVDKIGKNVRVILCSSLDNRTNFEKLRLKFDEKYKNHYININGYGLMKKIEEKEWNRISVDEIRGFIEKMKDIEEIEKYNPVLVNTD